MGYPIYSYSVNRWEPSAWGKTHTAVLPVSLIAHLPMAYVPPTPRPGRGFGLLLLLQFKHIRTL